MVATVSVLRSRGAIGLQNLKERTMGTITQLHERLRPVPNRIDADGEVLAAASAVVPALSQLPAAEALSRSGLLAVSVPSDFGGLDVSNVVLAEAVSLIAAVSVKAAEALATHCCALEAIRNAGSAEQRKSAFARSAAGECFLLLTGGGVAELKTDARFLPEGMGFRLEGEVQIAAVVDADWLAIPAADPSGQSALLLVPRNAAGVEFSQPGEGTPSLLRFTGVHVAADSVLALTRHQAGQMMESVDRLLRAAVVLGRGRRELDTVLAAIDPERDATVASAHAIGWRQVEIDTVHALILRAATAIDGAQVNPAAETIAQACRIAFVLSVAAQQMDTGRTAGEEEEAIVAALGRLLIAGRDEMTA
jgi:alkylation response protein AidB-like acyl-CoA dehydrogenase